MKKVLMIMASIVLVFALVACKKEDPAQAYLETASESLVTLIADPSNITTGFDVPTSLANGVTATWTSSNPGVVTIGTPASGFAKVTVNRPGWGNPDAVVTLTAKLTVPAANKKDTTLEKVWELDITVKASAQGTVVETITDIADLYDTATYPKDTVVRVQGYLIGGQSSYYFLQDATGGIGLYPQSSPAQLRTDFAAYPWGTKLDIVGTIYGTGRGYLEISINMVENVQVMSGEPALPAAVAIDDVTPFTIAGLEDYRRERVNLSGLVVASKVIDSYGSINYVFSNPVKGFSINGYVDNRTTGFANFKDAYEAIEVGDVVDVKGAVLSENSSKLRLEIFYAGQITASTTTYTDEQLANAAKGALSGIPTEDQEVIADLVLPVTGPFGSTVTWTSSNTSVIAVDGKVTRPAAGQEDATVTLGYTITIGTFTTTVTNIDVLVKAIPSEVVIDLFISEYAEGSSSNKYVEIYNPTNAAIDLSGYSIALYNNGATTAQVLQLSGSLAAGGIYIIASNDAKAEILAVADLHPAYVSGQFSASWNGDDAVALLKGTEILDLIGVVGERPASGGWTVGETADATKDHTLVRKSTVLGPSKIWNTSEWTVMAIDDITNMDMHTYDGQEEVVIDLFFSEYIEGSSNNKAIEIYNPTGAAVDLSGYSIVLYVNGSTEGLVRVLSGTLASGDVYVIANSQANATILGVADVSIAYASGQFGANWNGDDGIALLKGTEVIDFFGVPGEDPGSSWTVGTGATAEFTLVRKPEVVTGTQTWDATQWIVNPVDTFTFLGSHTSDAPAE